MRRHAVHARFDHRRAFPGARPGDGFRHRRVHRQGVQPIDAHSRQPQAVRLAGGYNHRMGLFDEVDRSFR